MFRYRRMQAPPQFGGNVLQLRLPPPSHRFAQHRKPSLPRLAAAMREAEEVKGLRFPVATVPSVPVGMRTKFDEARFASRFSAKYAVRRRSTSQT